MEVQVELIVPDRNWIYRFDDMLWACQTVRKGDVSAIAQWPKKSGPEAENALPMRNIEKWQAVMPAN